MINSKTINSSIFDGLCNAVGNENISGKIEERSRYSWDHENEQTIPDLVVKPLTKEHVSSVTSIANKHNIPIYSRCVNSNWTSCYVPLKGGIVVDLKDMNRIIEINARDLTVIVRPGVLTGDLNNELLKHKLFYPPGQGFFGLSTIGENVSKCIGNMMGLKYGVTRDYVLALEIVLADGTIINTGSKTLKSVAGYDLTRLFVGAEGTLGIITKVTLKLLPLPEMAGTIISSFSTYDDALNTSNLIRAKCNFLPRSLVFLDETCIQAVSASSNGKIPKAARAVLFIEVDGSERNVDNYVARLALLCKENKAFKVLIEKTSGTHNHPEDGSDKDPFHDIVSAISSSLYKNTPMVLSEDVCVPGSKVKEAVREIYKICERGHFPVAIFGNIGEGHIRINTNRDNEDGTISSRPNRAIRILNEVACIDNNAVLESPESYKIEIMKELKKMFDPNGILKPVWFWAY